MDSMNTQMRQVANANTAANVFETTTEPGEQSNLDLLTKQSSNLASANNVNAALTTFTCFDELPSELRRIIWNFTKVPRWVFLSYLDEQNEPFRLPLCLKSPVPTVLQVCKESREEMIEKYQKWPVFTGSDRPEFDHVHFTESNRSEFTYIDPVSDYIYQTSIQPMKRSRRASYLNQFMFGQHEEWWPQVRQLRNMAIDLYRPQPFPHETGSMSLTLNAWNATSLRTMTFVYHGDRAALERIEGRAANFIVIEDRNVPHGIDFRIVWSSGATAPIDEGWQYDSDSWPYRVVSCGEVAGGCPKCRRGTPSPLFRFSADYPEEWRIVGI